MIVHVIKWQSYLFKMCIEWPNNGKWMAIIYIGMTIPGLEVSNCNSEFSTSFFVCSFICNGLDQVYFEIIGLISQ